MTLVNKGTIRLADDPIPALVCDGETFAILASNAAAQTLLGYSTEEFPLLPLAQVLVPEQEKAVLERAFPALDDPVLAGRCRWRRKDGSELVVDLASAPAVHDGRRTRVLFALDSLGGDASRDQLLAGLFRRAQQQTVLASLARAATGPREPLRPLLGRMTRAAALALGDGRLSLRLTRGDRSVRMLASSEDQEVDDSVSVVMDFPLPFRNARTGILRASRRCGAWSDDEKGFLETAACLMTLAFERHSLPVGRELPPLPESGERAGGLTGRSDVLRQVILDVRRAARNRGGVLVTGEAGTGKKRVARAIHDLSPGSPGPFLVVNCPLLTEAQLERELFGAPGSRRGLLSISHHGTLVLEEIGDLSPAIQRRLVPYLADRGRSGHARDLRVIGTSRRNLALLVASGALRPEFYAGLAARHLHLPPLRERADDVAPLAELFVSEICASLGRERVPIEPAALRRLLEHGWPGNGRELRDVLQRALLNATGDVLHAADLPLGDASAALSGDERRRIEEALEATGGNRTAAAKLLGVSRVTLWKRLKNPGL